MFFLIKVNNGSHIQLKGWSPYLPRLQRPWAYSPKPGSVWLKLSRHCKQLAQSVSVQHNPINEDKGKICLKTKYHIHILTLDFYLTSHTHHGHPWFFSETSAAALSCPGPSVFFAVCLTLHILQQQPSTKCHLLHKYISAFPWSLTPIPTWTDLPLGLIWSLPHN